jgi:hypothetical protein
MSNYRKNCLLKTFTKTTIVMMYYDNSAGATAALMTIFCELQSAARMFDMRS